jgi:hypothetical protein
MVFRMDSKISSGSYKAEEDLDNHGHNLFSLPLSSLSSFSVNSFPFQSFDPQDTIP